MSQKTIIIAVIIILAIFGLATVGYFKAVPGVEYQTDSRPQIEITPKVFDFGEIEYGKIAEHTFKIKNLGGEVLEIKRVATSCACTSAEVGKKILGLDEETDLNVTYDTGLMGDSPHAKGDQERIIYVKSSDPVNPQVEVTIHAYVK